MTLRVIALAIAQLLITSHSLSTDTNEYIWEDCYSEMVAGGETTSVRLKFNNVVSIPSIVRKGDEQKVVKEIEVINDIDDAKASTLKVEADFHQYYKLAGKRWFTFLDVPHLDQCAEHEEFCPLPQVGETFTVSTTHPHLAWGTPYGWYRSRQIYRDMDTKKILGCVDMQFQYRAKDELEENESVVL
eukprot:CAMPEP_0195517666 /NCGR_PEP_ID=MMETSP0794_2-20130614/11220_1 /TAXON_ID=515487 /ORGANISM="Stephanopyxis turris, Strain CCMP 815" /LENGTH=186 /DNA_ID=CAMNT_0040646505 /DNA_START=33 /DNA_END=593 /DNA_ORIENTATION=+